jgi:SAM-dependent methyltransferase
MILHVGGGDFRAVGRQILTQLREHAGLTPHDRVLDIGCGTGRVATALSGVLAAPGGYAGFDITETAIATCRRRFAKSRPDFQFLYAPVRNGDYRPGGSVLASRYTFPFSDASFDLVFATSVYNHMPMEDVGRYLAETARVLAPGGRVLFTAYLLNDDIRARVGQRARMRLQNWRDGSMVADPRTPERAIAQDGDALLLLAKAAGLELTAFRRGRWEASPDYDGWQDLVTLRKAAA